MTHIEAMKQALEALENHNGNYKLSKAECAEVNKVCDNIRQAIATEESSATQEPVGYVCYGNREVVWYGNPPDPETDLYTHPQPKAEQEPKRKPLTDEIIGLLKEARKIIRASSSRNLVKDWDERTTKAIAAHGSKGEA